jgi:hypothetical protein
MRFRELAIVCVLASAARADELDARLAKRVEQLAESHYRAGELYRAITDYEELALFATDDATRRFAAIRIATSYHRARQFADAIAKYQTALAVVGEDPTAQALRVQLALARAERTFDEPGTEALDAIVAELSPSTRGGAYESLALYHLTRIQLLAGHRADAARTASLYTASCKADCPLEPILAHALAREPASHRSPWLGLGLSLAIPGAGSVYGGHPVDGIYYFALTALSALGAWDVYDDAHRFGAQRPTFYVLGALAAIFYAGSAVQGYLSVARYNAMSDDRARRALWRETEQPLPLAR